MHGKVDPMDIPMEIRSFVNTSVFGWEILYKYGRTVEVISSTTLKLFIF